MPSAKPNGSSPSRLLVPSQITSSNASLQVLPLVLWTKESNCSGSAKNITRRCGSLPGPPQSQCLGALRPTSPSSRARYFLLIPVRTSREKPSITESGKPSLVRPGAVNAICRVVVGGGLFSTDLLTGAARNQAFAAATFFTRTSA